MPNDCYFSVRDIEYSLLCDGYIITVTTDTPVHLFMRWTYVKPQYQTVPLLRRGIAMHGDRTFCFVAYRDNEQEEAGDTLTHTFIKTDWPICQTRYFYFWGQVGALVCKSTTAVFELHFDILKVEYFDTPSNRTIYGTHAVWNIAHDALAGVIPINYGAPWYVIMAGVRLIATYWLFRGFLFFDTTSLPLDAIIAGAYLDIFVTWHEPPGPGGTAWLGITEGVQSDPIVVTNYSDQLPYTTVGGSILIGSMSDGQYNRIPFNQAGLAFIKPGGITKLCLRGSSDLNDAPPPFGLYYATFHSSQAGIPFQPRLTVCVPP